MKLTGICRMAYLSQNEFPMSHFDSLPESCQNALIIDFLDSVGFKIIILPTMFIDDWGCDIFGWTECEKLGLDSRVSAQNAAIEKANELYNNLAQK